MLAVMSAAAVWPAKAAIDVKLSMQITERVAPKATYVRDAVNIIHPLCSPSGRIDQMTKSVAIGVPNETFRFGLSSQVNPFWSCLFRH